MAACDSRVMRGLAALAAVVVMAAAPDAGVTAYPEDWVQASFAARPSSCGRLVYKNGCRVLRRGRVVARARLDAKGGVKGVVVIENTVDVDPGLVSRCVRKDLEARSFRPPEPGMATELTATLVLSDKC